jgi:hypothetical protein
MVEQCPRTSECRIIKQSSQRGETKSRTDLTALLRCVNMFGHQFSTEEKDTLKTSRSSASLLNSGDNDLLHRRCEFEIQQLVSTLSLANSHH